MKTYAITDISSFLRVIEALKFEWKQEDLWFRGVSRCDFMLLPSLYRINSIELDEEEEMYGEFIRKAKAFIPDYYKLSTFDWYLLMQHYGFPTRLLDWTSGSLIALYFAVRNANLETDRCVYVMDPFEFNKCFNGTDEIPSSDGWSADPLLAKYLPNTELPILPLALDPPYIDKRIVAQKSCFTLHGKRSESLEVLFEEHSMFRIVRITIDNDFTFAIKDQLGHCGISESIVFPDLEGLAREMIYDYAID